METWYHKRFGDEAAALRVQKMFSSMFAALDALTREELSLELQRFPATSASRTR